MRDDLERILLRGRQVLIDLGVLAIAFPLALLARYDFQPDGELLMWKGGLIVMTCVVLAAQAILGRMFGLYTARWSLGSFEELAALIGSSTCLLLVAVLTNLLPNFGGRLIPLGAVVGGVGGGFVLMAGSRYLHRALREYTAERDVGRGERVLIVGAGAAGTLIAREMLRNPGYGLNPVGFLDDDPLKQNLSTGRVRVLGRTDEMRRVAMATGANTVIIAIPSADAETTQRLVDLAEEAELKTQIVPHVLAIMNGSIPLEEIREVRIEDLLGREPIRTDTATAARYIAGKVVLVTGAGGSIGQELCRQLQGLNPERVVLLDHDETNLHHLELLLKGSAALQSPAIAIGDIRDRDRVRQLFAKWKPDVVFHAAAHKHLPLLEMHPSEGVKTNVLGTLLVAEAAIEHGTDRFIFVSTDKAAQPSSVLGASKRVGELIAHQLGLDSTVSFSAVRFGNVLGSRGSVVPVFQNQLAAGLPLTVTHPDVTRYFMTIEEACQLVIQAGAFSRSGEIYVLDMGQPVRIADLARRVAHLARPDRPPEIRYTGLRPGEKLHEDLFYLHEERLPSPHPKIFVTSSPEERLTDFWQSVKDLIEAAERNDDDAVRARLAEIVSGYNSAAPQEWALDELYPDGL